MTRLYQKPALRTAKTHSGPGKMKLAVGALRSGERRVLAVEELSAVDIMAIRRARIPRSKRYRLSDIKD